MTVLASSVALFVSGAAFGASIAHWYAGGGDVWGSLGASVLVAVIATEGLRRALAQSRQSSAQAAGRLN